MASSTITRRTFCSVVARLKKMEGGVYFVSVSLTQREILGELAQHFYRCWDACECTDA